MNSVDWFRDTSALNLCGCSLTSLYNNKKSKINFYEEAEERDSPNTEERNDWYDDADDDESSVISSSGVSVLSIDYENREVDGLTEETVDLSDLEDDENSVVSCDSQTHNIDEKQEVLAIEENIKSLSKNQDRSNKSQNSASIIKHRNDNEIQSSKVVGNQDAEKQRKSLLISVRNDINTYGRYAVEVGDSVSRLAEFHESIDQIDMSVTLCIEALNIYSCKLGDHDSKVVDVQVRLGHLKEKIGDIDSALDYYCRALSMMIAMKGIYAENSSQLRINIARVYNEKGFHKEAIKELKKALKAFRDANGDQDPTVADTVDLIADVYTTAGNHGKANSVCGELVKLKIAIHGGKCSEVAKALTKFGSTFMAIGDLQGALKTMKQAYVMFHAVEGSESLNTEYALEQIGCIYSEMGKEEKAIKAHTSITFLRQKRYGENSVEVAKSYLALGKSFLNNEQYDKAKISFNKAIKIFGKGNSNKNNIGYLMDALHHLGVSYKKDGKTSQALKTFTKELQRRKKTPSDKLGEAEAHFSIGSTYYDLKKNDMAYKHLLQSLLLLDQVDGRRLRFAENLFSCGEVLKLMNNPVSEKCFVEVAQIYKANGYNEQDEVLQKLLSHTPHVKNIKPSLFCSIIDNEERSDHIIEV